MKSMSFSLLACLGLLCLPGLVSAETLRNAGVLGNSGEQGATLVRFGAKTASGLGVVYDRYGSMWDRAGTGVLNRYAVDGRQLATYAIAPGGSSGERDTITLVGDVVMLKLGKKLYTLPVSAPSGTAPTLLPVDVTRLSFNTHDGWAAAANGNAVFLVNATGEKRDVVTVESPVEDIDIGPEGGIYARVKGQMVRVDPAASADQRGPWPSPGERPQWLADHWYASAWHGTIRRFTPDFSPDPGVVLGGASGSFIGYVEGNHEMNNARGLAHLGGNLFAASGIEGGIHLLEWNEADQRFTIIRRISSLPVCKALAIDSKGRVWNNGGVWDWSDGPDAPVKNSVPGADEPGLFGASMLAGDVLVSPGVRWGRPVLYVGKLDGPAGLSGNVDELTKTLVASTVVTVDKRLTVVVVDPTGRGVSFFIGSDGKASGKAVEVALQGALPLKAITSLASLGADTLLAGADGQVIEFTRQAGVWSETRRWRLWDDGEDSHFGGVIYLTASEGRLWVADTDRQRVLCFDAATRKPVATFGVTDQAGGDLSALNRPQVLAANGRRGVVFDAGNQRLIQLELSGK